MTTSMSSEALLPFVAWPTDQQWKNICRIDAHIQEECAHKKWEFYLIYIGAEKIMFLPKPDRQTDGH